MSVWKKTAKANQKTHRERHQPKERNHLGLLEKKKDYIQRAKDYNDKQSTIKLLKKRALNKNPDEFYHHMINSKVVEGKHFEKETEPEDSIDQLKLMRSQDLKYVSLKRTQELRRIDKLQAQLHLASVDYKKPNRHIIFPKNVMTEDTSINTKRELLSTKELPDVDISVIKEATRTRKNTYKELAKRITREKELSVIQQKIQMRRAIEGKKSLLPPKRVKKGTKDSAPVYRWSYERKK